MDNIFFDQKGKPEYSASTHKLIVDGNSLVVGMSPEFRFSNSDFFDSGIDVESLGIAGQTWKQMTSNINDLESAIDESKENILTTWEGTNAIANASQDANTTIQDARDYFTAARAIKSDLIILVLTCLPRRQTVAAYNQFTLNQELDIYNDLLRSNYRNMGADILVDIRGQNSPFNLPDYSTASFATVDHLYAANEQSTDASQIHLNNDGYAVVQAYIEQELRGVGY